MIFGSFVAALVARWPLGRSVLKGRSSCDDCGHILGALELIPVVSFIVQSGKCRHCKAQIKPDHLAIEISCALVGGAALYIAPSAQGIAGAIFGWFLVALAALDAKHCWLPDRLTYPLAGLGLLTSFFVAEPAIIDRLIGGIAGAVALAFIAWAYKKLRHREGLGGGDPKLLGAIGCWLGWAALPLVLIIAALSGLLSVLFMRMRRENVSMDSALPLGSFMAIAAFPIWLLQTALGSPLL